MTTDIDPQALAERAARLEGWTTRAHRAQMGLKAQVMWLAPDTSNPSYADPPTLRERFRDRLLWLARYWQADFRSWNSGTVWEVICFQMPTGNRRVAYSHPDPDIAVTLAFCEVVEAARVASHEG